MCFPYLKLFKDFVILPAVFTKVFDLLAFWTTPIVLNLSALGVYLGTFGLIANWPILCTHARTVRVPREETLSEFVHKTTVIHAAFPSVVIKDLVVDRSLGLVRGVVLGTDGGWDGGGVQSEEDDASRGEKRAHPSPRQSCHIQDKC